MTEEPHNDSINKRITTTDILLQIVSGRTSVYVKFMTLDGTPELLSIRSNSTLKELQNYWSLAPANQLYVACYFCS